MMANTQKLIIFPKDYCSAFRVCNSFFRTVQFCSGFQSKSRFLLLLTIPFNDEPELQQTHQAFNSLPSEAEGNFARIQSSLLWRRSSQVSHPQAICSAPLTHGASSLKILWKNRPREIRDLELHRTTVNLEMDLSSSSESSFQLVTRVTTGVPSR